MKVLVNPLSSGPRNPAIMCVSGLLVIMNLTPGICEQDVPSTRRMADSGSSSLHSSSASITITVETPADRNGSTRNFCIWSWSDSWITSGLDWRSGTSDVRKAGYFCPSWNASVGKISWRLLRSSTPLEQKNDAPRRPSANVLSAMVCAIVDFPVPASPLSQKTGDPSQPSVHRSISFNTLSRVPLRQPVRFPS
jgi:hypothetical protein